MRKSKKFFIFSLILLIISIVSLLWFAFEAKNLWSLKTKILFVITVALSIAYHVSIDKYWKIKEASETPPQ